MFVWKSENAIWAIIVLKFLATTTNQTSSSWQKISSKKKTKTPTKGSEKVSGSGIFYAVLQVK